MAKLKKAVGPRGNGRRVLLILASLALIAGLMAVLAPGAVAVHDDDLFELDRNAFDDGAVAGDDWDNIYLGTDSASAAVFTFDGVGPTIFTGGGSKDDLDTTNWQHKTGSTPPKDELLDAYAARYGNNLYFGADRFANNGAAQMGFWFFQQDIQAQPDGTFGPGQHENGDILVLSDFTQGGDVVTIRVFQWNFPGGAINGTLDLIAGTEENPADCVGPPSVPDNDPFCATVNAVVEPSPWPFDPKSGPNDFFQPGEFYEGGIDLTFLNLENACFASFLVETRSSPSVDATLKDFVGGAFQPCETTVTTTPSDSGGTPVSQIVFGETIYDSALIEGTGSAEAPTGTMDFYICAPGELTDGTCAAPAGTFVSQNAVSPVAGTSTSTAISDGYVPNEAGTWCWRGEYSGDALYPPATDASTGECFTVIQLQPAIATAQTFTVKDSATITVGSAAGNLAGSVRFRLYEDAACAGPGTLVDQTVAVAGPSPQTVETTPVSITTSKPTLSWLVEYTSTNPGHLGVISTCNTENASLLIDNG